MRQLKLNIEAHLDAKISDFEGPSWRAVIDTVRQLHAGYIQSLYIIGSRGSSKSHLLSAIVDSYLELGKTAIKVSLLDLLDAPVEAINSLEQFDLVALDDLEAVTGVAHWQHAIFHLLNLQAQSQGQLVFTSQVAVRELNLFLPDLASRLNQSVSITLPDSTLMADREALVQQVLHRRGWVFSDQVIEDVLNLGPKKPGELVKLLEQLQSLLEGKATKISQHLHKSLRALIIEYGQKNSL